ncbi:MAG: DUF2807 domain-containing protein [Pseudomonadota bacterium]
MQVGAFVVMLGLLVVAGNAGTATPMATNCAYDLPAYTAVQLHGAGSVRIVQDDRHHAQVQVQDCAGAVELEVVDRVLYVYSADSLVDLTIGVVDLRELYTDGGWRVVAQRLASEYLSLESHRTTRMILTALDATELLITATGESAIEVSGRVERQVVALSDAGVYRASALSSSTGHLAVRGHASVELWVDELLDVQMDGDAQVRYKGSPYLHQELRGRGSVARFEDVQSAVFPVGSQPIEKQIKI